MAAEKTDGLKARKQSGSGDDGGGPNAPVNPNFPVRQERAVAHPFETAAKPTSTDLTANVHTDLPAQRPSLNGRVRGNLVAGVAMAAVSARVAADQPNASALTVLNAGIGSAIPGYEGAVKGDVCQTFGGMAGYVAGGFTTLAFGGLSATAAIALTTASGPLAPLVAPLAGLTAAGLTTKAVLTSSIATEQTATALCEMAKTRNAPLKP